MVNRIYIHDSAERWRIQRDQFISRRSSCCRRADEEFAHHLLTFHEMYCQEPVCVENTSSTSAALPTKPALRLTPIVQASSLSMMPNKETIMKVIKQEIIEEPQPSEELGYQTYTVKEGVLDEDWTEHSEGGQEILTEPKSIEQPETYLRKEQEFADDWTEDSGATGVRRKAESEDAVQRRCHSLQEEEIADDSSEESGTTEDFEETPLHVEESVHRAYHTDSLQEEEFADGWTEDSGATGVCQDAPSEKSGHRANHTDSLQEEGRRTEDDNAKEMETELSEEGDYEMYCVKEFHLESDCTEDDSVDLQKSLQENEVDTEEVLDSLNESDLKELGVNFGERRKLMTGINKRKGRKPKTAALSTPNSAAEHQKTIAPGVLQAFQDYKVADIPKSDAKDGAAILQKLEKGEVDQPNRQRIVQIVTKYLAERAGNLHTCNMEFVKEKLTEWGLEQFWPQFEENEIDEEAFFELDQSTVKELIWPLGPRAKLVKKLQELKTAMDMEIPQGEGTITTPVMRKPLEATEPVTTPVTTPSTAAPGNPATMAVGPPPAKKLRQDFTAMDMEIPQGEGTITTPVMRKPLEATEPVTTPVTTPGTAAPGNPTTMAVGPPPAKKLWQDFDIKAILTKRIEGENLIKEMEEGLLGYKSRKMIVNTLVSHLIEHYGTHVKSQVKMALARAITGQFPLLDNEDGDGYAAWFTPSRGKHDSSGFLEIRLKNVRRRDNTKSSIPTTACPSKLQSSILGDTSMTDGELRQVESTMAVGPPPTMAVGLPPAKKLRQDFDIKAILTKRIEGENLIKEMEEGLLGYKSRKMIVNTLVSHLIEHYGTHVESHVKMALAKAITGQFPLLDNEDGDGYAAWFTPSRGKHDSSGFLENRLKNVRRRDNTKSSIPTTACPSKLQSSILGDTSMTDVDAEEHRGKLEWLRCHNQPAPQVKQWMKDTVKTRAATIRAEKETPVAELVRLYPRLIDTYGMIDQDFRLLFPEAADGLFMKWTTSYEKVLQYVEKQVAQWKQHLHFSGEMDTETKKSNLALQALPLVFPPGCKKGKKGPQRSSLDEACRSFIRREKVSTNIPIFLEREAQTQPFVLALGKPEEPEQCFVVLEKNAIGCNSLLQAVDVCFKLVYVFDITFSWECQHTWDFIQKFFYHLGEGKGRNISAPSVTLLKNFLEKKS